MSLLDRARKGWNVFRAKDSPRADPEDRQTYSSGMITSRRPDRRLVRSVNTRSIMNAIINRIGVDVAAIEYRHVKLDEQRQYESDMSGPLNDCFLFGPNIDQGPSDFRRDIAMTLLEEGSVVIVPTETDIDPDNTDGFKIEELRVGTVVGWSQRKVRVRLFRDETQKYEEITIPKRLVAIAENPFYSIMNEQNSTLQRLARKMALMDAVDEQIGAGKLDLIIQLPYVVKTETKRAQAEERRSQIEDQLTNSQYGLAYTDGSERVIQLNRPVENNLLKNVESLTQLLYSQLGITDEILNGTASEQVMLNYQQRIVRPILDAIVESMIRKFLSKTARSQGQSIEYFQNPFALVPPSMLADLGDKLTRNAILSTNEFRPIIGFKPVKGDPMADKLVNKNMPQVEPAEGTPTQEGEESAGDDAEVETLFNDMTKEIDDILKDVDNAE